MRKPPVRFGGRGTGYPVLRPLYNGRLSGTSGELAIIGGAQWAGPIEGAGECKGCKEERLGESPPSDAPAVLRTAVLVVTRVRRLLG